MQVRIPGPYPDTLTVIETMRAEPDGRIALWPRHLQRLCRDCAAVGFPLDLDRVHEALAGLPHGRPLRVRLTVDGAGFVEVGHADLPANPAAWRVILSPLRLRSDDPWLRVKTSHRPVYGAARAALPGQIDEALLLNERGDVCDGTITTLFVRRGGRLLTPPLTAGVLPGILRAELIATGVARVARLGVDDLVNGDLFCGNALRGLIAAQLESLA